MTDKQIIIDGVPVQDCQFLATNKMGDDIGTYCRDFNGSCKNIQNCYFKRWQRKEQESEADKMEADEGKEINAELKAENDNLKSLIWWIHVGAEGADKATTEYYENRNTPYEENYWKRIRALQPPTYESKYKLALTEIKEITEPYYTLGSKDSPVAQILQKISECEGNDA